VSIRAPLARMVPSMLAGDSLGIVSADFVPPKRLQAGDTALFPSGPTIIGTLKRRATQGAGCQIHYRAFLTLNHRDIFSFVVNNRP
jgi:hypothetical protein